MLTEFYYYYYILIEKQIKWSKTVHDWPGRIRPFWLISEIAKNSSTSFSSSLFFFFLTFSQPACDEGYTMNYNLSGAGGPCNLKEHKERE
jgi:hypothetical protein